MTCNYKQPVEIKFKATSEKAKLPKRNNESTDEPTGDTGYDIYGIEETIIPAHGSAVVPTGITVAYITPGYWWKVESRSGLSFKHSILAHPGVIDNAYRGNTGAKLYNHSDNDYVICEGERIAQLVVYKLIEPIISWTEDDIEDTVRGGNGHGSSGKY